MVLFGNARWVVHGYFRWKLGQFGLGEGLLELAHEMPVGRCPTRGWIEEYGQEGQIDLWSKLFSMNQMSLSGLNLLAGAVEVASM